ncbi:MAG TPA: prenyltransferase/squalene oxidase repeat-containing protein [Steroidobacteraceae bacterium]|nr:prenyltransferase/squalene oxidase repeat-containing protein [Steroidobacteraceae bacterium]
MRGQSARETGISRSLTLSSRRALQEAARYILSRQCTSGGFCFYRHGSIEEPNLKDTYYAVGGLRQLHIATPRHGETVEYVARASLYGQMSYLYHYAFTLSLLGEESRIGTVERRWIDQLDVALPERPPIGGVTGRLESVRRAVRLHQYFDASVRGGVARPESSATAARARRTEKEHCAGHVMSWLQEWPNYPQANLWDAYVLLSLASYWDVPAPPCMREWVESLQRLPVGFGMTARSTMSNLEVVYAGVRACELLGLAVHQPAEVLEFTLGCQMAGGGFARAPVSLPDLQLTYRAIHVITALAPEAAPLSG